MFDFIAFFPRAVAQGVPLMLGSTGETLTQKSGNLNLGLPGVMYVGAICGVIGSFMYENSGAEMNGFLAVGIPVLCCLFGSLLMGLLYCFLTVTLRANQNVTGLAMTTFGVGFGNFFGGSLIRLTDSEVPSIALSATSSYFKTSLPFAENLGWFGDLFLSYGALTYIAIIIALICSYFLKRTRSGLNLRAVGEDPATADAAGINVTMYKYRATCIGCMIAGLGGLYYVMDYASGIWSNDAFGDRGWLAIALVIFTMWRPAVGVLASILFGGLYILYLFIPSGTNLAVKELYKMLPYLVTIAVLIIVSLKKSRDNPPPPLVGLPYYREERKSTRPGRPARALTLFNYAARYEHFAGIQRCGLAGAGSPHRGVKSDVQRTVGHGQRRGVRERARVPHAHAAAELVPGRRYQPVCLAGRYMGHVQPIAVGEDDLVRLRAYLAHEHTLPGGKAEPAPLPERIAVAASVGTHALAFVDERSGAGRSPTRLYPRGEVPVLYEAYLHAVGLVGLNETKLGCERADLALYIPSERQHKPPRLLARYHTEHVALVVFGAASENGARPRGGVVSGGDALDAQGVCCLAEQLQLYAAVAQHAWAGRRAREVRRLKGRADLALKGRAGVYQLKGQPHALRALTRVASLAGAGFEVDAAHVPALHRQQLRRDGAVHAAGKAQNHARPHVPCLPMYIASAAMSAGETPEMRPARPKLSGRTAESFCLASVRSPGTAK